MKVVELRPDTRWILTATALAAVVLVLVTAAPTAALESPELLALAIAFLLTVEAPLFIWLVFLRTRRTLPFLVAMSSAGVLIARLTVVGSGAATAFLIGMAILVFPIQLFVFARVLGALQWQRPMLAAWERNERDLLTRLRAWAQAVAPNNWPLRFVVYEVAVVLYAAGFGGRGTEPSEQAPSFSVHRETGLTGILYAGLFLGLVEVSAVHGLVSIWSTNAAWLLSAVECYGLIWIVGFLRSLPKRPIEVQEGSVVLRFGLACDAVFASDLIGSVDASAPAIDVERRPDRLWCAVFGQPNVLLSFRHPVIVSLPYGLSRKVRSIAIQMDRPLEFAQQLEAEATTDCAHLGPCSCAEAQLLQ